MTVRERIDDFLAHKRIAMVGISRYERDFSRMLYNELVKRGYDVVPVNPRATEVAGRKCYRSVLEVQPPVEAALLMTSRAVTMAAVQDCARAGVKRVWMYRAAGAGAVAPDAIEFCDKNGIEVVPGHCPFMFFPHTQIIHRFHGLFMKVTGTFPR